MTSHTSSSVSHSSSSSLEWLSGKSRSRSSPVTPSVYDSSPPEIELGMLVPEHQSIFEKAFIHQLNRAMVFGSNFSRKRNAISSSPESRKEKTLRRSHKEQERGSTKSHGMAYQLGIKVVDSGGRQWFFSGLNSGIVTSIFVDFMKRRGEQAVMKKMSAEKMRKVLALTAQQFERDVRKAVRPQTRIYKEMVRRSMMGLVTKEPIKHPVGRRNANIVGLDSRQYHLPKDILTWFERVGIKYQPKFNPRRRERIKGQVRDRYVFAFAQGAFSTGFVEALAEGQTHVHASRNWQAICPIVPRSNNPRLQKSFLQWVMKNAQQKEMFCGIASLAHKENSHAVAYYAYLEPVATHYILHMILLDPHAMTTTHPDAIAQLMKGLARINHDIKKEHGGKQLLEKGMSIIDKIKIEKTNDACGFKQKDRKMLAAQYALEGSCVLSSVALVLSIARLLKTNPLDAFYRDRRRIMCRLAYEKIRAQDVVIAAQMARAHIHPKTQAR